MAGTTSRCCQAKTEAAGARAVEKGALLALASIRCRRRHQDGALLRERGIRQLWPEARRHRLPRLRLAPLARNRWQKDHRIRHRTQRLAGDTETMIRQHDVAARQADILDQAPAVIAVRR